jgi:hypothetical protein
VRKVKGIGNKVSVVLLPWAVRPDLGCQLLARRAVKEPDLLRGVARVEVR